MSSRCIQHVTPFNSTFDVEMARYTLWVVVHKILALSRICRARVDTVAIRVNPARAVEAIRAAYPKNGISSNVKYLIGATILLPAGASIESQTEFSV